MQTPLFNPPKAENKTTEYCGDSTEKVLPSFNPTSSTPMINNIPDRALTAADFKHILTAEEPGNNVDSLTWFALDLLRFRYNHDIQPTASNPWSPMDIRYPDLERGAASQCFDPLEAGYPCAVEDPATGRLYMRMRVVNNDDSLGPETELKFTAGSVLLVGYVMATVTLKAGINQVIYTGTSPLSIGPAPLTATNVRLIYRTSPNNQGYVSNLVGGNQAAQPFKQLVAAASGALPQGYTILALRDFTVDGALFGLVSTTAVAPPADSFPCTVPSGGGLVTDMQPVSLTLRPTIALLALPTNVSSVAFRLNEAGYGSLVALNMTIAALPDSTFSATGSGITIQARITRLNTTAATVTFTATY